MSGVADTDAVLQFAPVVAGAMAQILFYGMLLIMFERFVTSPAWTRAHGSVKAAILFTVALSTTAVAFAAHGEPSHAFAFTGCCMC